MNVDATAKQPLLFELVRGSFDTVPEFVLYVLQCIIRLKHEAETIVRQHGLPLYTEVQMYR